MERARVAHALLVLIGCTAGATAVFVAGVRLLFRRGKDITGR